MLDNCEMCVRDSVWGEDDGSSGNSLLFVLLIMAVTLWWEIPQPVYSCSTGLISYLTSTHVLTLSRWASRKYNEILILVHVRCWSVTYRASKDKKRWPKCLSSHYTSPLIELSACFHSHILETFLRYHYPCCPFWVKSINPPRNQ